jgi:AraC-like DNA-binding protein
VTAHIFGLLDVAASIWDSGVWHDVCERPYSHDVRGFEAEHGIEWERHRYNERCLAEARSSRATVVATHAGLNDLFVPICAGGRADAVLVTGPVATARPTSTDILERWRVITGRQGHPSDPEFLHYVDATLRTLTLEGKQLASFRRLAECLALLISGQGDANAIYDGEIEALRKELAPPRLVDRVWEIGRALVDDRTSRSWASPMRASRLADVGLPRFPEQVVVGLFVDRHKDGEPVEAILRRNAFQRACVGLSRASGHAASGQIGGHGVTFVASSQGSPARTRRFLDDLSDRASSLARRRFGLELYLGIGTPTASLCDQYQAALAAAESALSGGVKRADAGGKASADALEPFWHKLPFLLAESPAALATHFDRYLEAIAAHSGHRLDLARAQLEGASAPLFAAVASTDALDVKSATSLRTSLRGAAGEANTLSELFAAYRSTMRDLAGAMVAPRPAARDRSLRRAEQYVQRHYAERCTLGEVARVCGFEPTLFSRLFHAKHHITFRSYLMRQRVERGRQLLSSTSLNLQRVAQLSGLSTRYYLGRVFKRVTGETPIAYRRRTRLAGSS